MPQPRGAASPAAGCFKTPEAPESTAGWLWSTLPGAAGDRRSIVNSDPRRCPLGKTAKTREDKEDQRLEVQRLTSASVVVVTSVSNFGS